MGILNIPHAIPRVLLSEGAERGDMKKQRPDASPWADDPSIQVATLAESSMTASHRRPERAA